MDSNSESPTHLVPYDTLTFLFSDIHPILGQDVRASNVSIRSIWLLTLELTSVRYIGPYWGWVMVVACQRKSRFRCDEQSFSE
jgi:hypothetical protein